MRSWPRDHAVLARPVLGTGHNRMVGGWGWEPGQPRKTSATARERYHGSTTAVSSRAECIERMGTPTSTARMPRRVALSGPIVEPHGTVFFDTNSWLGTPARAHARAHAAAPFASVVYRWFALILRIGPPPARGRFAGSCRSG